MRIASGKNCPFATSERCSLVKLETGLLKTKSYGNKADESTHRMLMVPTLNFACTGCLWKTQMLPETGSQWPPVSMPEVRYQETKRQWPRLLMGCWPAQLILLLRAREKVRNRQFWARARAARAAEKVVLPKPKRRGLSLGCNSDVIQKQKIEFQQVMHGGMNSCSVSIPSPKNLS